MRFYNSGKFMHQMGRNKDTGDMVERELELAPKGHPRGTAIVSFPGSNFHRVVKAGEWVDLPFDIDEAAAKSACPALLTEEEYASLAPPVAQDKSQPAVKPAKG